MTTADELRALAERFWRKVSKPSDNECWAWSRVHRMPPGPRRAIERAATFPGLAEAAAEQWGGRALEIMDREGVA